MDEKQLLHNIFGDTPAPRQMNEFKQFESHMTVGDLRKKIEGLPDDTPVLIERIEDVYFEKHGWTTVDFEFFSMERQRFFQAWSASFTLDKLLIHGHY